MQSFVRGFLSRRRYETYILDTKYSRYLAAVRIQSFYRSLSPRRSYREHRVRKGVVRLQALYRGGFQRHRERLRAYRYRRFRNAAATTIQRIFRGYFEKKLYLEYVQKRKARAKWSGGYALLNRR